MSNGTRFEREREREREKRKDIEMERQQAMTDRQTECKHTDD